MPNKRGSTIKGFILGGLIGAAVGVVATILYAPQNTKEARRKIKHKGKEVKNTIETLLKDSQELAEKFNLKEKCGALYQLFKTEEELPEMAVNTKEASTEEKSSENTSKRTTSTKSSTTKKPRFFKRI